MTAQSITESISDLFNTSHSSSLGTADSSGSSKGEWSSPQRAQLTLGSRQIISIDNPVDREPLSAN